MRRLLILSLVTAFALAPGLATGSVLAAGLGNRLELKLADRGGVDRIELEVAHATATRPERRAVSDLLLDLTAPDGDIAARLTLPNGKDPAGGSTLISARLILVSGGRLMTDASASCGPWEGNISVCAIDCDGGRFALRRFKGSETTMLRIMIGALPRGIEPGERPGFAVTPCGLDVTSEIRLVPKPGGRPLIELTFTRDASAD